MSLTQEAFKEMWKKQLLPEIRREIRSDSEALKQSMTELSKKFDQIETSQKYLSSQYDSILAAIGEIKKQVQHVENQTDETWSEINKMKGEKQVTNEFCIFAVTRFQLKLGSFVKIFDILS